MYEIVLGLLALSPLHPIWMILGCVVVTVCASVLSAGCNLRFLNLVRSILKE